MVAVKRSTENKGERLGACRATNEAGMLVIADNKLQNLKLLRQFRFFFRRQLRRLVSVLACFS